MNYVNIINLALQYSDSEDVEVINNLANFVLMAESKINRELAVRPMFVRATLTIVEDTQYYSLPDDFRELRSIKINGASDIGTGVTLNYVSPERMTSLLTNNSQQEVYTIIANQVQVAPVVKNSVLEIVYAQSLPHLSEQDETNWLSEYAPDAYVYGILVQIAVFTKDADAMVVWNSAFNDVIESLTTEDDSARWSGTPLFIRIG